MRMYIGHDDVQTMLTIENNGEYLTWGEFKPYQGWYRGSEEEETAARNSGQKKTPEQNKAERVDNLLREINAYWASRDSVWQSKLFNQYRRIHTLISQTSDISTMVKLLIPEVRIMIDDYHDLDDIADFLETQDIRYPSNVADVFDDNDGRHRETITYTKAQYFGLACLTTMFRAMIPVWTDFRCAVPKDILNNRIYFELELLRIIRDTHAVEHPFMQRLIVFVESAYQIVDNNNEASAVIGGVGTTEIPNYLLASAICNKLVCTPLSPTDPKVTLVSSVFNKIKQDTKHIHVKVGMMVRKRDMNWGNTEDDKTGYFESYSATQKVASDVIIANQVYLYDYRRVRRDLDDVIPTSTVVACIESLEASKDLIILGGDNRVPVHQTLVQWILANDVMVKTVPDINRRAMINAMGVTQAALIHWGFHGIARLMSTVLVDDDDYQAPELVHLNSKQRQALDALYRFHRPIDSNTKNAKPMGGGRISVEMYTSLVVSLPLKVVCTSEVAELLRYKDGPVLDYNLRVQLAELMAFLVRRQNRD